MDGRMDRHGWKDIQEQMDHITLTSQIKTHETLSLECYFSTHTKLNNYFITSQLHIISLPHYLIFIIPFVLPLCVHLQRFVCCLLNKRIYDDDEAQTHIDRQTDIDGRIYRDRWMDRYTCRDGRKDRQT